MMMYWCCLCLVVTSCVLLVYLWVISGVNFDCVSQVSASLRTNSTTPVVLPLTSVVCTSTQITGLTPAGFGQGLSLVLTIGSQTSVSSMLTFGYVAPTISGLVGVFDVTVCDTCVSV